MLDANELELLLRDFLKTEVMLTQIEFMSTNDELSLDSLAQTELRVYLEEKFGFKTDLDSMPIEVAKTLSSLIGYIINNVAKVA